MIKNKEKIILYIIAFTLPMIIWLGICFISGIYPFGSKSIMTGDITYQFIDYLSYYKSIILSNNDFIYTFSKTIGGDMAGFSAYYLLSPFNLIILFFSNSELPLGLLIIIILKAGLMSLSFFMMLTYLYGLKKEAIIFSLTYSLMGYAIVYYQLYEYYDNMMLLPVIIIGIHMILDDTNKKLCYIISLFLSIIINFYIGYMLCIFSVLYFLYQLYIQNKGIKEIISFIISSVISGLLSGIILFPSLLSLQGEKNSINIGFYRTMRIFDLFGRLLSNTFKGNISSCLPNIYCGVLFIFLLFLYFLNSNISKKEKIASIIFIVFMVINLYINTLNVIWHGFNSPIGFPYRYSFLLTFIIILFSYKGFINYDNEKIVKKILISAFVIMAYLIYAYIYLKDILWNRDIIYNAIITLIISIILILNYRKKFSYSVLIILLFVIQIFDITENMYSSFKYFDMENINEYQEDIKTIGAAINLIKDGDKGFYRIEKHFRRSHNDSMQFNYNGLTHYSSCEKKEIINYMERLGFRNNGNWSFYDSGSTSFVDTILGVKYILSQYSEQKTKPLEKINKIGEQDNTIYTYLNKCALPMMYFSTNEILNDYSEIDNTFELQNRIADSITGKENNIFQKAELLNIEFVNVKNEGNIYHKIDKDKEAYIIYTIKEPNCSVDEKKNYPLKAYFKASDIQNAKIIKDDCDWEYFNKYNWNILDLGRLRKKEKEAEIKVSVIDDSIEITDALFYYENINALNSLYNEVIKEKTEIDKITSSHLEGKVSLSKDGIIVLSIPYDESWKIYVDKKSVNPQKAADMFLAINVEQGDHVITYKYIPRGMAAGFIMTIIGIILLIIVDRKPNIYNILWSK